MTLEGNNEGNERCIKIWRRDPLARLNAMKDDNTSWADS